MTDRFLTSIPYVCKKTTVSGLSSEFIHIEQYRVRGYDVDLHKQASIPTIIQMMHDTAMEHVLKLKLSAIELDPLGLGWVLVRQQLQVFRQPSLGQTVQVKTYPSGRDRAFAYRDFLMLDEDGIMLASASTTWLLMDIHTRRIARYPDFITEWMERSQTTTHLPRPSSDIPALAEPQISKSFRVNWHDLDFNRHLTNFYYQKWMLETTPTEILENCQLQDYRILFKGESLLDDTVEAHSQELEPGVFVHSIRKDGQEITSGWTKWKQNA
jgi:medium-chain acyl-[acyl-carrier-protein] hydrolase